MWLPVNINFDCDVRAKRCSRPPQTVMVSSTLVPRLHYVVDNSSWSFMTLSSSHARTHPVPVDR